MKKKTLIIAEAGVNHNGDLVRAKQLIDAAARAGADLVKFQTFSASRLVTRTAIKADYQTQTTDKKESQHEMLRRLELTAESRQVLTSAPRIRPSCSVGSHPQLPAFTAITAFLRHIFRAGHYWLPDEVF